MELWIRSQNKEKLVKVNELSLYDSNILKNDFVLNDEPNYSNIGIIANDNYNLGSYKSKERAIEVLNKISKLVENAMYHTQLNNEVLFYQMPEKEEDL